VIRPRPLAIAATLALLSLTAAGCSSTREQAAKFTQGGNAAFTAKGLRVNATNRSVKVIERAVVTDANGTAAVVVLKNAAAQPLADVPIAIAVQTAKRKVVWRNDAPGLEPGLTHAALLAPGQTVTWVNDQVQPSAGKPAAVTARVGAGSPIAPSAQSVRIDVAGAHLEGDPASGVTAVARATNASDVPQKDLVIAAVARKDGRIVAAGRAIVPLLKAHDHQRFQVFFIGDPRGAELSFDAQPSTLR
jgi:hypothetical protein